MSEGPDRTAALVEWIQGQPGGGEVPILVGGAAVELFTGGAYRTGDLDFVGRISPEAGLRLRKHGFRRAGRHWIRDEGEIFIELPAATLDPDEMAVDLRRGEVVVRVIAPEDLVIDRLAAWQFWESAEDAVNAFLIWRANDLDRSRLEARAERREVLAALRSLEAFRARWEKEDPCADELARWASGKP